MIHVADLHIHSRFARSCSKNLTLQNIDSYCRIKGVTCIATGDCLHPAWFKEINSELEAFGDDGLFCLKGADRSVKFVLATEISCIYKKGDKVRRIHVCLMTPTIESVEKLIADLERRGCNLRSDGRPIIGLSVEELTKVCLSIEPRMFIWPAHIWTPWFSMFGSKSGFDLVEDCFGDMTPYIHAIETGLSSDPPMNWRVSQLDRFSIISNSDAHSLQNIAREANVFEMDNLTYDVLCRAICEKDNSFFLKTIEFYPEEGMYHFDGHRTCKVSFDPCETARHAGLCPVCNRDLTIGVMNRISELADRSEDYVDPKRVPFVKLVELDKIIAQVFGVKSRSSKKVQSEYHRLIGLFGSELKILMDVSLQELSSECSDLFVFAIERMRSGKISVIPGFDGEYGHVSLLSDLEKS